MKAMGDIEIRPITTGSEEWIKEATREVMAQNRLILEQNARLLQAFGSCQFAVVYPKKDEE